MNTRSRNKSAEQLPNHTADDTKNLVSAASGLTTGSISRRTWRLPPSMSCSMVASPVNRLAKSSSPCRQTAIEIESLVSQAATDC